MTYLGTVRSIERLLEEAIKGMYRYNKKSATETLEELVDILLDYTVLVNQISFDPPSTQPDDHDLVSWCLETMRDEGSLRASELSDRRRQRAGQSAVIDVISGFVIVPLSETGSKAFAWTPLLNLLGAAMEGINECIQRLLGRVRTDCDGVLEQLWSAVAVVVEMLKSDVILKRDIEGKIAEHKKNVEWDI